MTSKATTLISMKAYRRNTMAAAVSLALYSPAALMAQGFVLEEVMVTAQKREERSMDVPIAIGTFTPQNLADTGALSIQDIDAFIPGFESGDDSFTQNGVTIRGVSTPNISTGGDPSVATFYDDSYVPSAASTIQFSDIASIEVLKGPQGTLFGRNAAAGVVSIQPNSPSADADGFVSTRIGNFGLKRFEGMINVPITDAVFFRANLLKNERDGYQENTVTGGRDPEEQNVTAGRLSLLWEASDSTITQFSFDFDDIDNGAQQAIGVTEGAGLDGDNNLITVATGRDPYDGKVQHDIQGAGETRQSFAYGAKLFHDINDVLAIKVVASYREWETYNLQDEDGTANVATFANTNNIEDSNILYTELQFNYTGDKIIAVFGANYSEEDVFQDTSLNFNSDTVAPLAESQFGIPAATAAVLFPPGNPITERIENTGDFSNYGVYGDITYKLTDHWTFSAGLRYSYDEKEFTWLVPDNTDSGLYDILALLGQENFFFLQELDTFPTVNVTPVKSSDSWSKVTGRALVKYQINDNVMTFLSYSTGYKSGGFDSLTLASAIDPIDQEETSSVEWGIKGDLFDNRLRTQFSVFKFEDDNKTESKDSRQPDVAVAIPTLVGGDETIEGYELQIDWLVTEDLKLGLVTTERDSEETLDFFYNASAVPVPPTATDANSAKEYTVTLDWVRQLNSGELLLHMDYQFQEDTETDQVDFNPIFLGVAGVGDDRTSFNARLAWTNSDEDLTVAVWGQNLTDEEYVRGLGTATLSELGTGNVSVGPPRTYGIDVRYSF
jgi:iron complex outermembrane receptor protein